MLGLKVILVSKRGPWSQWNNHEEDILFVKINTGHAAHARATSVEMFLKQSIFFSIWDGK